MRLIRPEPTPIPLSEAWLQSLQGEYQDMDREHLQCLKRALEREHQLREMMRNGVK